MCIFFFTDVCVWGEGGCVCACVPVYTRVWVYMSAHL